MPETRTDTPYRDAETPERLSGRVIWFNDAKGFGFIRPDGATEYEENIFVHYRGIRGEGHRTLVAGAVVEFDVVWLPRGRSASDVVVVGS